MFEKSSTFTCRYLRQGIGNGFEKSLEGPCRRFPQEGFHLRKNHFDRVEVRTVWRQEHKTRACRLDRFSDSADLVTGEVIADHYVSLGKCRDQLSPYISEETLSVHCCVDKPGRCHSFLAQGSYKGRAFPMPMRNLRHATTGTVGPTVEGGHFGIQPGFVNEHQFGCIPVALLELPSFSMLSDVTSVLLGRESRFFYGEVPYSEAYARWMRYSLAPFYPLGVFRPTPPK